jgi:hypothetical protein
MKIIIFIVTFISLFLIGCSSIYTVKDFSSKDKYYEDFNSFVKNKNVKVTLNNDSSLTTFENTRISDDTLILMGQNENAAIKYIPLRNVKTIYYKKNWPGIIPGVISGFLLSFAIAGIGESSSTGDTGFFGGGGAIVIGVPAGTILGGIIGWFLGYEYTYQFNP